MTLMEAALHCEKARKNYAEKNNIKRDKYFYLLKMQEELGELSRRFLELNGSEKAKTTNLEELKKKFEEDCASVVRNALILALHFNVDLEKKLKEKFSL